jgi:predicted aldo/keto reductase-like oxidoreductase
VRDSHGFLSLADIAQCASDVGGQDHHFGVIQLPYNLSMREAFALRNQKVGDKLLSTLEVAGELGLAVMASASMLQGSLSRNLPDFLKVHLPNLATDAQRAIQFVRSTPGVTSALVGMSRPNHVEENLQLVEIPTISAENIQALVNAA